MASVPSLRPTSVARSLGSSVRGSSSVGAQVAQQAAQRRLAVQRQHAVALGRGDLAHRPDRLAALGHARQQRHVLREGHARQPALPHAVGDVAQAVARRGQAAEQVAGGRALAHLQQQVGQVGGARVGMHQRAEGVDARQRPRTGEDLEALARQLGQHQHQRRLVEVLHAAGRHAHAHAADPGDARPALAQRGQQAVGLRRVVIGEVDEAQRRFAAPRRCASRCASTCAAASDSAMRQSGWVAWPDERRAVMARPVRAACQAALARGLGRRAAWPAGAAFFGRRGVGVAWPRRPGCARRGRCCPAWPWWPVR